MSVLVSGYSGCSESVKAKVPSLERKSPLLTCIGILRPSRRGRARSSPPRGGTQRSHRWESLEDPPHWPNLEARRPTRWMFQLDPSHRSNLKAQRAPRWMFRLDSSHWSTLEAQMPLGGCPNWTRYAGQGHELPYVGAPTGLSAPAPGLRERVFPKQLSNPPSNLGSLLPILWTSI